MSEYKYPVNVSFDTLVGKTLTEILRNSQYDDTLTFVTTDGEKYQMFHASDCCESVSIEDINGDLADLIGSPITLAEESTSDVQPVDAPAPQWRDDAELWTFYRLATEKGYVTIRWYGSSNGYYSVSVSFQQTFEDTTHE